MEGILPHAAHAGGLQQRDRRRPGWDPAGLLLQWRTHAGTLRRPAVTRILRSCRNSADSLGSSFGCLLGRGAQHHVPHFHAYYQEDVAVIGIESIEILAGSLPRRQRRLVEAWVELHQPELMADWRRLQAGQPPHPIAPLQ